MFRDTAFIIAIIINLLLLSSYEYHVDPNNPEAKILTDPINTGS
jgi:hypothetical protein